METNKVCDEIIGLNFHYQENLLITDILVQSYK